MSVIQKIRDKYARLSVILIAIALIGFILIDYVSGRSSSLFKSGSANTIGRINGKRIDADEFRKKVKQEEDFEAQQQTQFGKRDLSQIVEAVWNQEVDEALLTSETNKLGMQVGAKEINDVMFGKNPPQDIKSLGTDQQTGLYDVNLALQQINAIKKRGTPEQKARLNAYVQQLETIRLTDKYNSLIVNSSNFPKWFLEKQNTDNSLLGKISFVRVPYTDSMFVDSTIKVSDKEIQDYIDKHKDDFKQEESRSIEYVVFSASPSSTDSAATKNSLADLKDGFKKSTDVQKFLDSAGTEMPYYSGYISSSRIQQTNKDSILRTSEGDVYGPYLDGSRFVLARNLGVRSVPDTVKVRHILVATTQQNPQTGEVMEVRDSASAKKLIDSLQTLIRNGANFDTICKKFSDDPGSKDKGGVYDKVPSGQMVAEFNDFIFLHKAGDKGIVKTSYGYHYIEILSQKGSSSGYKIAYMAKSIEASKETDDNADNAATQFAGDSRDIKAFDANYDKNLKSKQIIKAVAVDIKPNDYSINGLGAPSRQFIKDIYAADKGDVLQPERIGDQYIVAAVYETSDEGTMSVEKVRSRIEPLLRNKKKAEMIRQKLGKITSLETAAATLKKSIETADSLRMTPGQRSAFISREPRIIGATFNPDNRGKVVSEAIEGGSGIYALRVDSVTATAVENANVPMQQKALMQGAVQNAAYASPQNPYYPLNAIKKAATIKDNRAKFY